MPSTPTSTTTRSFGRNRRLAVAALAFATVGFLAGCSGSGGGSDAAKPTTTTVSPIVDGGSSTTVAPGPTTTPDGGTDTGSNSGTNSGSNGTNAPAPAPQPKGPTGSTPVITSFHTPDNIDCHNGNFKMFSASWTTTGATKTVISIDGPGAYKTYGPNGSDSLPFNCSSPHTFLLTAYGSGNRTATRTITLQPRNVQPSQPSNDDDTTSTTEADQGGAQGNGTPAPNGTDQAPQGQDQ